MSFELEGLIPFDGDGHWFICLDYRKNKEEPEITYIDVECDNEYLVEKNFEQYLSKLKYCDNKIDYFVIRTNKSMNDIKNLIENIFNTKFDSPNNYAFGYYVYTAELKKDDYLSLSANSTTKGFVRKDDERYNELIELSFGKELRHPELLENDLLIRFTETDNINI